MNDARILATSDLENWPTTVLSPKQSVLTFAEHNSHQAAEQSRLA